MRLVMALVGLAAVTGSIDAPIAPIAPIAPVAADPLGSAQATAAALSQEVIVEAVLVHQLSERYQSDTAQANYLGGQVASSQASVHALQLRSQHTESLLRREALLSYTDEVPATSSVAQFGGNLVELAAQRAYLSLTLGDVSATVLQLQSEQAQLSRALSDLRRQYRSEVKTGTLAADQRGRAISEAAALQGMLAQAQSRVALLTSEQHAQAGLPVGNGIVNAVNQQLGTSSSSGRTMASNQAPSTAAPNSTGPATVTTVPVTTTVPATTVPPATAPPTTAPPAPSLSGASGEPAPLGGVWLELRDCESGDNYQEDTGNGFYGAYQFAGATWSGLGLPGVASDAPYWEQDEAAQRLQAQYGWKPWPACSAALGL